MHQLATLEPVDYLLIGHLTHDVFLSGERLGGTVAYAGLMAHALGLRVGLVTSWAGELPLNALSDLQIANILRLWLGESVVPGDLEEISVLQTQIDDLNPQAPVGFIGKLFFILRGSL